MRGEEEERTREWSRGGGGARRDGGCGGSEGPRTCSAACIWMGLSQLGPVKVTTHTHRPSMQLPWTPQSTPLEQGAPPFDGSAGAEPLASGTSSSCCCCC